jgi:hypothetical protein
MRTTARPCLISCGVFTKEVETLVRKGDLDLDLHFLSMNLHTDYAFLEKALRAAIEARLADCTAGIVVAYGNVCLGFRDEMRRLVAGYNLVKIDALNCIDCLLGGRGKLLEIDPEHQYLFLNEAFIKFSGRIMQKSTEETRKMFSMLKRASYYWIPWVPWMNTKVK